MFERQSNAYLSVSTVRCVEGHGMQQRGDEIDRALSERREGYMDGWGMDILSH